MFYWITNGSAIIVCLLLFGLSFVLEKFSSKRFTIRNIAMMGMLCALSVVLTNVVGYSRIFGIQIMFGNFVIFLAGMAYGPQIGVVTGLVSDGVGEIINPGGVFHAGFLLEKVIFGFLGAFVFLWKTNKLWMVKVIVLTFISTALGLLIINPISLWSMGYVDGYVYASFIKHLISLPIETTFYSVLTISSFRVIVLLTKKSSYEQVPIWFMKNGDISFLIKRRKSELEKIKEKQKSDNQ